MSAKHAPHNRLFPVILLSLVFFFVSIPGIAVGGDKCPSSSGGGEGEKTSGGSGIGVAIDITGLLKHATKKKKKKKPCCEFKDIEITNIWSENKEVKVTITGKSGPQTKIIPPRKTFVFMGDFGDCVRISVASTEPGAAKLLVEDRPFCCKELEGGKKVDFYGIDIEYSINDVECPQEAKVAPKGETPPPKKETPPEKPPIKKEEPPKEVPPVEGPKVPVESAIETPPEEPYTRIGIDINKCDYNWMPEQGNRTYFTAKIYKWVTGKGWVFPGPPQKIVFMLSNVTKEKGVCLNKGDQTTPDLYFKGNDPGFDYSGGQTGFFDTAVAKNAATWNSIEVISDDYGSFGRIEAYCDGCEKILPNGPVTIPLDENGNTIADCAPQDDKGAYFNKDKDAEPVLDGYPGDGYTNYEEYRGFFVRGAHKRTDITKKDLLVNDRIGRGVGYYPNTNISVHLVANDELKDRVGNFNRGHGTTGAQHGIVLKWNTGDIPYNVGGMSLQRRLDEGIMGPPKNVTATVLNDWSPRTVAHELSHSTCVWHHGEAPWGFTRFYSDRESTNGMLASTYYEFFRDVLWMDECTLCGRRLPSDFRFHPKGAQQSGDVDCVMKYCGFFEVYLEDGVYKCWPANDPQGTGWCTSKAGTGYNSGGLVGGDATVGNCLGQLRVNDK